MSAENLANNGEREEVNMPTEPILKSLKSKADGSVTAAFPYDTKFVKALLKDVHLMFVGDSLMRGIYKDVIVMLHGNDLIDDSMLKSKTEPTFFGDKMIDVLPLEKDRVFRQAREYHTEYYLIQYLFTTRVMKDDIETALLELCTANEFPDVLFINSCLWDITRYNRAIDETTRQTATQPQIERTSLEEFLERISMLLRRLRLILPATTQVVWVNMPWPLPVDTRSFQNRAGSTDKYLNRMLIVDANFRASQLFRAAGYDVLDIAFYMRNQALYAYRVKDGVHWDSIGTRIMSQLVVGHLARSWNIPPPRNIQQKLNGFAENALSFDGHKNWAVCSLIAFTISTLSEGTDEYHSFPELLQRKIRAAALREIKESDPKLYDALMSDIRAMRMCKVLEDNPGTSERLDVEHLWELDEMVKAFPKVAECIGQVAAQEVTLLVNNTVCRKRKHVP
ncbi:unnamed protein product [Cylicocyclus nassatus]|uniref:Uncharacterized protein n=1 Tax=Cylicocyclus nassatus TaxID=53992 RepID=A0AA36GKZ2_CYLNA|nr:unnamed protein product [Cylicocyclus nassatus]